MTVYLDGAFLDEADARIRIDDRGFLYGDGVFETVRLHQGGFFRLGEHVRRMAAGAEALRLPMPAVDRLAGIARELADRNGIDEGGVRITLTRGRESAGGRLAGADPTLLVTLRPMPPDWRERAERGWSILTARTAHPGAGPAASPIKSLGRTAGILARIEAEAAGVDDALLLSAAGEVVEGASWNVFWRTGDALFTPALDTGLLAGVTRGVILALAREAGATVLEGRWPRAVLDQADEVFATMTSLGVVSFRRLDGRGLPRAAATMAGLLRERYWRRVEAEVRPAGGGPPPA